MKTALSHRRAFTLLELILTLGILTVLATGVFSLASAALQMTEETVDFEERELTKDHFIELCRENFEQLPGSSRLRLDPGEGGAQGVVSFMDSSLSFGFGRPPSQVARVLLYGQADGAGHLTIQTAYLTTQDAVRLDAGSHEDFNGTILPLLRNVNVLRWRFHDPTRNEWVDSWFHERRPSLAELTLQLTSDPAPVRVVFWIPERSTPPRFELGMPPNAPAPPPPSTPAPPRANP